MAKGRLECANGFLDDRLDFLNLLGREVQLGAQFPAPLGGQFS